MTGKNTLGGHEYDPIADKFIAFVESHSIESTSGLIGDVKNGEYSVIPHRQSIPFKKVKFAKFHADPESPDFDPDDIVFVISLHDGPVERFGLAYYRGAFHEHRAEEGFRPAQDLSAASMLVTELELHEQNDNLKPL